MKNSILIFFILLFMLFNLSTGFAQTSWKGITSSNWATASNWTAGVPDAITDVFIGNASFTGSFQPTISLTTFVRSISIGEYVLSELTVLDSLTINGNININPNGSLVIGNTLMSVSGNLFNDGNVTNIGILNFNPNTTPVNLQLSGISFSSAGLIQFGGSEAISISGSPTALQDVIISNTNPAGIAPASDWNMTGNFSVNSNAIFNAGNHSYLVQGNIIIDGTMNGNASTFAMSGSTGQLDASTGTTFNHLIILGTVTSFSDVSLTGDFINYGSFDGSLGTLIMTGSTDAVIGGSTTPLPIEFLSINKTGAAVVTADVDINNITTLNINSGTLSTSIYTIQQNPAGGTINIASGGTLKIGGYNTLPAFSIYGFDTQSTVDYAGTDQTISNDAIYGNLTISNAGDKSSPDYFPLTVTGDFTISAGNFIANDNIHSIAGNWIMTGGTFDNTNSIIVFNGTNDQSVYAQDAFNSIGINKSSGAINLLSDITVINTLTFVSGKIQTGNFTVIIPGNATVTGAGQSNGWVVGNLKKNVDTGSFILRAFEIGDTDYYSPSIVLFADVSSAGNLTGNVKAADHPAIYYSGIDSAKSVNRYWSLLNDNVVFSTADVTLNWVVSDTDPGAAIADFKTASLNGSNWNLTNVVSPLPTSIQTTGLTSLGDIAIGEKISLYKWTGEAYTDDWFTAQNWSGGVPTINFFTLIPNGITGGRYYPVLSSDTAAVNDLVIENSASLNVFGGALRILGTVTNNGSFSAANGTIEFKGLSVQTISPGLFTNNIIKNLIIDNNVSLTGTDTLTGTLTIANGRTFTTNNNLVLRSDSNGTARIASLPVDETGNALAYINGAVSIERFIPKRKAWRLLSTPVRAVTSPTINAAWQEGFSGTLIQNPNPGYGVFITGGPANNGFDQGLTSNTTIKVFNSVTNSFVPLPQSPGTNRPITDFPCYYLYVRGDRSINLMQGNNAAVTTTTLRMKGEIITGNKTFAVNPTGYSILGNPYPSAINFETLTKSNVKNSFYLWDPKLSGNFGLGGYVTLSWNSGTGTYDATSAASPVSKYIQSGEAVIIESADGINPGTITVKESDKSGNGSDVVFGRTEGLNQQLRVNLFSTNADGSFSLLDGVLTTYSDVHSNNIDNDDAKKLNGGSENIGIKRSNRMFAIERRKTISSNDTTFLNIYQMKIQNYQLSITSDNLDQAGIIAVLKDNYLNVNNDLPLNLNGTTKVNFNINSDPASFAINRFSIVFRKTVVLPVTIRSVKAYRQQNNIAVEWKAENEINISQYEVEKSVDGSRFTKINTTAARSINTASFLYKILDTDPIEGSNYYRICAISINGKRDHSNIVKVNMQSISSVPSVVVYPNPVTGKKISIQFHNIKKGDYQVQLLNASEQVVAVKPVHYIPGVTNESFEIDERFAAGKYELKLMGEGIRVSTKVIKK